MVQTISRDELKAKIDRRERFLLVETLSATTYHHAHLPGAINLPPDQVKALAAKLLPDKDADIVVYCASPPDTLQKTLPVNWRLWDIQTCAIMPKASLTGLTQGYLLRVNISTDTSYMIACGHA
jgi:hypothetical protein